MYSVWYFELVKISVAIIFENWRLLMCIQLYDNE